jgi:hypothetical protein
MRASKRSFWNAASILNLRSEPRSGGASPRPLLAFKRWGTRGGSALGRRWVGAGSALGRRCHVLHGPQALDSRAPDMAVSVQLTFPVMACFGIAPESAAMRTRTAGGHADALPAFVMSYHTTDRLPLAKQASEGPTTPDGVGYKRWGRGGGVAASPPAPLPCPPCALAFGNSRLLAASDSVHASHDLPTRHGEISRIKLVPKLTVRVRFPSPAPHAKSVAAQANPTVSLKQVNAHSRPKTVLVPLHVPLAILASAPGDCQFPS